MNNEKQITTQVKVNSEDKHPRKIVKVKDSEMSYVDTGVGDPIVFLHGNPTSAYLWRNIIPYVSDYARCLAPDLIGMGQSGKPSIEYTFADQVRYLDEWFIKMNLRKNVTLVLHDWGSALGFHWAHRNPEKIKAIAYMESIVQPRLWSDFHNGRDAIFRSLRSEKGEQMIFDQNFFIEMVLPKSIIRPLADSEMEMYRAPFLAKESRKPTLQFAKHLPIEGEPADLVEIVDSYGMWLMQSKFPKLLINAEPGALLTGRNLDFARTWPNQKEVTVKGIHYIQEDSPDEIGKALQEFYLSLEE